jgi:hypothetical protein
LGFGFDKSGLETSNPGLGFETDSTCKNNWPNKIKQNLKKHNSYSQTCLSAASTEVGKILRKFCKWYHRPFFNLDSFRFGFEPKIRIRELRIPIREIRIRGMLAGF